MDFVYSTLHTGGWENPTLPVYTVLLISLVFHYIKSFFIQNLCWSHVRNANNCNDWRPTWKTWRSYGYIVVCLVTTASCEHISKVSSQLNSHSILWINLYFDSKIIVPSQTVTLSHNGQSKSAYTVYRFVQLKPVGGHASWVVGIWLNRNIWVRLIA